MKRRILITGVAGGIGSATANIFAEAGWYVIGVDRRQVNNVPGVSHFIHADISEPDAPEQIFEKISEQDGQLHALVNNAAIQICKPLIETTPDEWDAVMASNLRSVFLSIRYAYLYSNNVGEPL